MTGRGCRGSLRAEAEHALEDRLFEIKTKTGQPFKLDRDSRYHDLSPLLVNTLSQRCAAAALRDIGRGDGGELAWSLRDDRSWRPPSLHSVFSSCGAALNSFGPWRLDTTDLRIGDHNGFTWMEFEVKLPIAGLTGKSPNLDVVLANGERVVAIESKLLETLSETKAAEYPASYSKAIGSLEVSPSWNALYETGHQHFCYVGVGQLVRHYLGLKTQTRSHGQFPGRRMAVLLYIYWEPDDRQNPVSSRHREEVEHLLATLEDPMVRFEALSYRDLWRQWAADEFASTREHAACLEERYGVALSGPPPTGESRREVGSSTEQPPGIREDDRQEYRKERQASEERTGSFRDAHIGDLLGADGEPLPPGPQI